MSREAVIEAVHRELALWHPWPDESYVECEDTWRERLHDEAVDLVDAALSSGLCVLVDDLEQAGALIHEGYADSPMPFYVFHALPGKGVEPLYRRLPVLIAEEEKP